MKFVARTEVVPRSCTWDKMSATVVRARFVWGCPMEELTVRFEDEFCGPDGKPSIAAIPADFHDIDVRRQYTKEKDPVTGDLRYGSATHREVIEARIGHIPGMLFLVSLLNRNNGPGAPLKNAFPESLVKLIRGLYEVAHNVPFVDYRRQVLLLMAPVVNHYFDAAARDLAKVERIANPFCMEGYTQILRILGTPDSEIERIDALYLEKAMQVKRRKQLARQRAAEATAQVFEVPCATVGKPAEAHFIHSNDRLIGGFYFDIHERSNPRIGMVIIRNEAGEYVILTRGPWDLHPLESVLSELERGRWHFERRYRNPMLLNGSASRASIPSGISPQAMTRLVLRLCRAPQHLTSRETRRRQHFRRESRADRTREATT